MKWIVRPNLLVIVSALVACHRNGDGTADSDDPNDTDQDTDTEDTDDTPDTDDTDPTNEGACDDADVPGFATSTNAACVNTIATDAFELVIEWYMSGWTEFSASNYILVPPVIASLTDDNADGSIDEHDVPDILVVTFDPAYFGFEGVLRAVSGDGSAELWSVVAPLQAYGAIAAGDIDGDGIVEVLATRKDGAMQAFEHDGTPKWTSDMALFGHLTGFADFPAIADLDHDGEPEIVLGNTVFDNDGTFLADGAHGYAHSSYYGSVPTTVDLDANGVDDILGGNAAYRSDGSDLWYNAQSVGFPAVADFDADGEPDIVVAGEGNLRVDDREGNVLVPAVEIPGTNGASWGGPPVVADFDGDGEPEVGVASWDDFRMFDTDLSLLWTQTMTQDQSSGITGATAFDFDGDGVAEVVYSDEIAIWILAGPTGEVRGTAAHTSATWLEYPVVVDVDADNHAEIVVVGATGITVYGDQYQTWGAGRRIWNEYAYHITNVNDDGTIPVVEEPSWDRYNSFRSGDLTAGDVLEAPDLALTSLGVCEDECSEGNLVVSVQTGNEGAVDLGVTVRYEVYALLGDTRTLVASASGPASLPVGTVAASDTIRVTGFNPASVDSIVVRVTSDEGDCDATNDEVLIPGPFCDG